MNAWWWLSLGALAALYFGMYFGAARSRRTLTLAVPRSDVMCVCTHEVNYHQRGGRGSCPISTRPGYECACRRFLGRPVAAAVSPVPEKETRP